MKILLGIGVLLFSFTLQAEEMAYECHSFKEKNGDNISIYIGRTWRQRGRNYKYVASIEYQGEVLVYREPVINPHVKYAKDIFISKSEPRRGFSKRLWDFEIYKIEQNKLLGVLNTYNQELNKNIQNLEIYCIENKD